jgi:hypothetical protein
MGIIILMQLLQNALLKQLFVRDPKRQEGVFGVEPRLEIILLVLTSPNSTVECGAGTKVQIE